MDPAPPLLSAPRPRYALYAAMVLAPCVALGGWAWLASTQRAQQDEAGQRSGYRALAEDAGRAALADLIDPVLRELMALSDDDAVAREARLRRIEALPLVVGAWSAAPAPPPPRGPHPALADARRLEHVVEDHAAALDAYRRVASAGPAGASAEAAAGEIGALIKLARVDDAAAALRAALASDVIAADDAAALALALAGCEPPPTALAATMLAAGDRALRDLGDTALSQRVITRLATLPVDADDATARDLLISALARSGTPGRRERVAGQGWRRGDGPRWRYAGDEALVADAGGAVVVAFELAGVAAGVERALAAQPGLGRLATAYRERYGRDIASAAMAVPTPWGEPLATTLPPAAPTARWAGPSAQTVAGLALAAAVALIAVGLALLARAARREVAAGRQRSDFASAVTHELKTPLALIRMFGEMLAMDYARDAGERREYARIIVDEARRLGLLIGNVLEAAAIERGVRAYAAAPIDIGALCAEVLDLHRPRLEGAGFAVAFAAEAAPRVTGDRDALTQALLNLIDNAVKYSPREKVLDISVRGVADRVTIAVGDRGMGIAPADQQRIFRPFARGAGEGATAGGVGLGLAIVRAIAEAHGGTIALTSEPGRGSVFTLDLPAGSAPVGDRDAA
ncbi:MAG TPA: HAMP domain-containing sensor histidine kinase [Planctomycetota bacterium]|nr:HAMP domain-containing sensor histidine kinase [Planctomycetota bacterium]